jgi:hypothetical protein
MPVDLWGPTNQGLQNLNQAFTNKMTWDRQDRLDEENRLNSASHRELQGLQTQEAREKLGEVIRLKDKRTAAEKLSGAIKPFKDIAGEDSIEKTPSEITQEKAAIYQGQGLYGEAKNIIDMDEALAKYKAMGGDPAAYLAAEKGVAHMKEFGAALAAFKGNPAAKKQYILNEQAKGNPIWANFDVNKADLNGDGILYPVQKPDPNNPGKTIDDPLHSYHIDEDGKKVFITNTVQKLTETDYIAAAARGDKGAEKVVKAIEAHKKATQKPPKPEAAAKPTNLTALNPESGNIEYLMNDNTFSGRAVAKVAGGSNSIAVKRLSDMVEAAGDEPTASDIEVISAAAEPLGMTFEKVSETKPGTLWGTNTKEAWRLIGGDTKSAGTPPAAAPADKAKDSYGFTLGDVQKGHKYIGNNKWQKL